MDLLAPCRSCLQCLPFFQVSPPSSPRASSTTTTSTVAAGQAEVTLPTPDPNECTQSSTDAALPGQDLPASDKNEEPQPPFHSLEKPVIAEDEGKPVSEIVIAPPISSPPSSNMGACSHKEEATNKNTTGSDLPLRVPFINDISFSTSGLMPLPSPMTPAPFGTGYGYTAGEYHPSPHIYPPQNENSQHNDVPSHAYLGNSSNEHVDSHDGNGPFHHGHDDSDHGHSSSHHDHEHNHSHHEHDSSHNGHSSSHHGHGTPPDESLPLPPSEYTPLADNLGLDNADGPNPTHDATLPTLETSYSTPGQLDAKANNEGSQNGEAGATIGDSTLIETYHSEPLVAPFHDDDDSYAHEDSLGRNDLNLGGQRRRRDHFKEQFKGIRQQIKQGGHHIKEEGSKHLQTIITNINKQAQQIDQSGSFFIVPRAGNN